MARQPVPVAKLTPSLADVVQQHEQAVSMRANIITLLVIGVGLVAFASFGAFVGSQFSTAMVPIGSILGIAIFGIIAVAVARYVLPRLDAREQKTLLEKIDTHIEQNTNRAEKRRLARELRRQSNAGGRGKRRR